MIIDRIINMFGQVGMGKPGAYFNGGIPDTAADRLLYFTQCLNGLRHLSPTSIAMPYKIGCGLAGGDWPTYLAALEKFATTNPSIQIVLYKLE